MSALYAVVLFGLIEAGAPVWVLLGVAGVVALPAVRHRSLVHRRVHLGVGARPCAVDAWTLIETFVDRHTALVGR